MTSWHVTEVLKVPKLWTVRIFKPSELLGLAIEKNDCRNESYMSIMVSSLQNNFLFYLILFEFNIEIDKGMKKGLKIFSKG